MNAISTGWTFGHRAYDRNHRGDRLTPPWGFVNTETDDPIITGSHGGALVPRILETKKEEFTEARRFRIKVAVALHNQMPCLWCGNTHSTPSECLKLRAMGVRWAKPLGSKTERVKRKKKGRSKMLSKQNREKLTDAMRIIMTEYPHSSQKEQLTLALERAGMVGSLTPSSANASQYAQRAGGTYQTGKQKSNPIVAAASPLDKIREGEQIIKDALRELDAERNRLNDRIKELDNKAAKYRNLL